MERRINADYTNIAQIDWRTYQVKKAFEFYRRWITDLALVEGKDLLVAAETGDDQVLFLKASSNKLVSSIPFPRSIVVVGSCAVVSSQTEKQIFLIDLSQDPPTLVEKWDLSYVGNLSEARIYQRVPEASSYGDPRLSKVFCATSFGRLSKTQTHVFSASGTTCPRQESNL